MQWALVRSHLLAPRIAQAALVLEAVGIPSRVDSANGEWQLRVPPLLLAAAESELAAFARENVASAVAVEPPRIDSGWIGVIAYLLVIWSLPTLEGRQVFGWSWTDAGVLDAHLVLHGQWWRTVTALTLHADLGHLLGNSIFGAVFGLMLGRHLGSGLGWLLVVLCGALGNAIDAALRGADFQSLGASTATFATLAIVGAFVTRRGYYRGLNWRRRLGPAFAAFALLAFTGFGGERTDLVAHLAGFATGAVAGTFAAVLPIQSMGTALQRAAGMVALCIVVVSWMLAGAAT
ncbi:MAG: rhomboid family intramembrane serine protease [Gammaproteobacteria bacterium]|nr:rhomboid family intramembrane serine protease [Gammaproteobacteria bacterium]